jgi:hypothetical protein
MTYRLRIDCTTSVLRWRKQRIRESENGSFAMTIYREAASRIIFSNAGSASFATALGPVIFT